MTDLYPGFVLVVGMERAKLLADVLKVSCADFTPVKLLNL